MGEILIIHLILAIVAILGLIKWGTLKYYRKITFDIDKYLNKQRQKTQKYLDIIEKQGYNFTEIEKNTYIMYREQNMKINEIEVVKKLIDSKYNENTK